MPSYTPNLACVAQEKPGAVVEELQQEVGARVKAVVEEQEEAVAVVVAVVVVAAAVGLATEEKKWWAEAAEEEIQCQGQE